MSFGVEGLASFVRSIPLDVFHLMNFRFISFQSERKEGRNKKETKKKKEEREKKE